MAHALMRAASALLPTLGEPREKLCREESRHGTHECVRHVGLVAGCGRARRGFARTLQENQLVFATVEVHA